MTIYIDIILMENLIMNFIILYATGLVLKRKIKNIRLILASLLGAVYSLLAYISTFEIYTNMILKIILSILIVYIAFNAQNVKQIGKDVFNGCTKLKSVKVNSKVITKVGANTFKKTASKLVIKVPSAKLSSYKKIFKGKGQSKKAVIKK